MRDLLNMISESAAGGSEFEVLTRRVRFYADVVERIDAHASENELEVRFWKVTRSAMYILEGTRDQIKRFEHDMSGSFNRLPEGGWTAHFSAGAEMYIGYYSGKQVLSTKLARGMERRVLATPQFPWPELGDHQR